MGWYTEISFAIEMMVFISIFCRYFKRKQLFYVKNIVTTFFLCGYSLLWTRYLGIPMLIIRYLSVILILYGMTYLCYEERRSFRLFAITAAYSIQSVLYIVYTGLDYVIRLIIGIEPNMWLSIFCYLLVYIPGVLFSIRVLSASMKDKKANLDNRVMIVLAFCIILVSNVFNIFMIHMQIPIMAFELIYKPMSAIPCVLLLCLQFNLLSNQELIEERTTLERLLNEKNEQYYTSKENIELIQMKCHDLKYQIASLMSNKEKDNEALQELKESVDIYESSVKTGNEALDVIFTEKSLICQRNKINIMVMLDGSYLNNIKVADLYSIFGNAIDNAIEAVSQLEDEEKKIINITSSMLGNLLSIRIVNYYSGNIKMKDGFPQTSKEDNGYHGFGLKSINYILQKYGGTMSVHQENNMFTLTMLIPIA